MAMVNRTGGKINLTMLGKNLTTGFVDVYQILITTGDPVTFSNDPLSSGNYDMITVRGRNGAIIGQVQGDEQDPQGEISFSFYEDFSYLNDDYIYGNSKNMMLNLFNGEAFVTGGDTIVPIGTNGTDKGMTAMAKFSEMNKPYKYLYYNEGEFIREQGTANVKENGAVALKKNPYSASFNQSHKTICMEFLTTSGDGQVNKMFPILAKSTAEWAEGDINQFNLTAQRGCDLIERTEFYTEIYPDSPDNKIIMPTRIWELYVTAIVADGGTEPLTATEGDYIVTIDATGKVTLKKFSSGTFTEDADLKDKILTGTRFKSNKLIDSTEKETNCFTVIGKDGLAVDFSTKNSKRFYCLIMDFNKDTSAYEEYLSSY